MALKPLSMLHLVVVAMLTPLAMCQASSPDRLQLMADKHEDWMSKFGKTYQDEEEKAMRLKVFHQNADYIEAFNQQGAGANKTYTLALNKFADLTNQEFMARRTSYRSELGPMSLSSSTFKYAEAIDLPASIDWRDKGAVTGVKNQLTCGCCWAFTAIAVVEGFNHIKTGILTSFSEQELVDCDREMNMGCRGGAFEYAFNYIINKNGLTTEDGYPYQGSESAACNSAGFQRVNVSIDSYETVPKNSESSLMKAVAHQPVSVAIDGYDQDFQLYGGGVFNGPCGTTLNHGVTVVGYGVDSDGTKYWLLKNSWGTDWGENGYMRVKKDVDAAEGLCGLAIRASYPIAAA